MDRCPPNHYQCGLHGLCIEQDRLCNGVNDCPDGSDEFLQICTMIQTENAKKQSVATGGIPCNALQTFEVRHYGIFKHLVPEVIKMSAGRRFKMRQYFRKSC
jgi:hypothetical protein